MLRMGPDNGPTILAFPALFEEANRTRAVLVGMLRRLAQAGWSVALPDLPGQGESSLPVSAVDLTMWHDAAVAAAEHVPGSIHVVAVRGGALIDTAVAAASRWHWSPLTGAEQVRELTRIKGLSDGEGYAGNHLSDTLLAQLRDAAPSITPPPRVVRMASDPRPANLHLDGLAPWRASEPVTGQDMAARLADDLRQWLAARVTGVSISDDRGTT